jgi:radical SAM protein with 4Fe4S-binding SPASM domain
MKSNSPSAKKEINTEDLVYPVKKKIFSTINSMHKSYITSMPLPEAPIWEKQVARKGRLLAINLEVTARCNNNCRHCYINVPADSREAKKKELSFEKIKDVVDQACSIGTLWCLITGGEPLLRDDFEEIYIYLKKKGLLISVFTNATLINRSHIDLFKKWPPRNIDVTVYGVTEKTYEKVTRTPGSFNRFMRGLNLLLNAGIPVSLKAMAIQSNKGEFEEIARFCREKSNAPFRFDPLLHLRLDGDPKRNQEIRNQRLTPKEITVFEQQDTIRFQAMKKGCDNLIHTPFEGNGEPFIFRCGTGLSECTIGYDGTFRLCSSLMHPDCVFDLNKGRLAEALTEFVPVVRDMRSVSRDFLKNCRKCPIVNLCHWCPAHAFLEVGRLDSPVNYFCDVANARKENLEKFMGNRRRKSARHTNGG